MDARVALPTAACGTLTPVSDALLRHRAVAEFEAMVAGGPLQPPEPRRGQGWHAIE